MSGTGARENADGFKVSVTKLSESRLFASLSRIKTLFFVEENLRMLRARVVPGRERA